MHIGLGILLAVAVNFYEIRIMMVMMVMVVAGSEVMIHYVSHLVDFGPAKNGCDFSRFLHGHDVVSVFFSIIVLMEAVHGLVMAMSAQGVHI